MKREWIGVTMTLALCVFVAMFSGIQCSVDKSTQMLKQVKHQFVMKDYHDIEESESSYQSLMNEEESNFKLLMNHAVLLLMVYGGYAIFKCVMALLTYLAMPITMYTYYT